MASDWNAKRFHNIRLRLNFAHSMIAQANIAYFAIWPPEDACGGETDLLVNIEHAISIITHRYSLAHEPGDSNQRQGQGPSHSVLRVNRQRARAVAQEQVRRTTGNATPSRHVCVCVCVFEAVGNDTLWRRCCVSVSWWSPLLWPPLSQCMLLGEWTSAWRMN